MSSFEDMKSRIVWNVTFPFTNYLYNIKRITAIYKELLKSERCTERGLEEIQLIKLKGLIDYAYKWIPYYRDKFNQIGLLPGDIKGLEDLRFIPPLERREVIDHHMKMVDFRLRAEILETKENKSRQGTPAILRRYRKEKLVKSSSSGSTGEPTVFFEDGSRTALCWAQEMRSKKWFGVKPGVKEVRMKRITAYNLPNEASAWIRKHLWNQLVLPGMNLSEREYEWILVQVLEFRPQVLWGITSALTGLADYVLSKKDVLSSYRPKLIATWAAPLYPHEKDLLERAFNCNVTNIYGTREVGHVASLCPHGSYHINQENLVVESVNIDGGDKSLNPPELLVTTLDVHPMPFIRYRVGDCGELSKSSCPCGRNLQVLSNLLGRTGEIFFTKDNRMISPNFWCGFYASNHFAGAIKRFQIVYTKSKDIIIKIEKGPNCSENMKSIIEEKTAANFSPTTRITFKYVTKIEADPSRKPQLIVNQALK